MYMMEVIEDRKQALYSREPGLNRWQKLLKSEGLA